MMNYLLLGHILKDLIPDDYMLGGTASYASVIANALGIHTQIITSFADDLSELDAEIHNIPTEVSTTFQNIYIDEYRQQYWLSTANSIGYVDIPAGWHAADIVHLAPMAQELDPKLCKDFPNSLVGVTVQGWLRSRTTTNDVTFSMAKGLLEALTAVDVLVLSLADCAGDRLLCNKLLHTAPIGVETLGVNGCDVHMNGKIYHVPTIPQEELDPTGAGDVFATALFIEYHRCGDMLKAAEFANNIAAMSVKSKGIKGLKEIMVLHGA